MKKTIALLALLSCVACGTYEGAEITQSMSDAQKQALTLRAQNQYNQQNKEYVQAAVEAQNRALEKMKAQYR